MSSDSSTSNQTRAVVDIQDAESFKQHVQASKDHDTLLIAFFWADFHEASKPGAQMDQLFHNLASRHPDVDFIRVCYHYLLSYNPRVGRVCHFDVTHGIVSLNVQVNGEEVEDLAEYYNITSVPAFVFIKVRR